jgi:sigma-B regulation protein RsbU (phosphoserine phosphatase)
MRSRLLHLRLWLEEKGLLPKGKLAFITWYFLGLDILLFLLQRLANLLHKPFGKYLGVWVVFLSFVVIVLFCVITARRLSSKLLWRLRNRLIVTYIFIGVIPIVLLLALAGGTFYLLAGQIATFIATSRLNSEIRSLAVENQVLANAIAADLEAGRNPETIQGVIAGSRARVAVWFDGQLLLDNAKSERAIAVAHHLLPVFSGVVRDEDRFFLRSMVETNTRKGRVIVVASELIDSRLLLDLAANLGEVTLGELEPGTGRLIPRYSVGSIPPPQRAYDFTVSFGTHVPVVNWAARQDAGPIGMSVGTRLSTLYAHLFSALGDIAPAIEFGLFFVAVVLAIFELAALFIGTRLTRTVTGAVGQIYLATTHVNRGDFSHRIPITSNDQLAALATSFNLMTESLEKLLREQKEKQRLENEITIAQEVQAQLFPRHIAQLPSLEVYGFCRPARSVSGDYYDFLPLGTERMVLAVGDVSGKGISAALLMATIHSAVRAYSMEGVPAFRQAQAVGAGPVLASKYDSLPPGAEASPGMLLSLLNHQLYHSTPMEKYATLFLALYDGAQRRLTFSNAGHLPPMVLGETGSIRRLEDGGTVVGLFDDIGYDEGSVQLRRGDIFLAYSDGVTEPENDFGEFGEQRLVELVQENRDLPLDRIAEIVTAAVDDWIGAAEQPDDVTLVLARAR